MDKQLFNKILQLILFAFLLFLVVLRFDDVIGGVKGITVVLQPIVLGAVIAFILNRPTNAINKFYNDTLKLKFKENIVSSLALLSTYIMFFILIVSLFIFVLPQFSESLQLLYLNMDNYLNNSQDMIDYIAEFLKLEQLNLDQIKSLVGNVPELISDVASGLLPGMFNFASSLISSIINIVLGFIISLYILSDKRHISIQFNKLLDAYMKPSLKEKITRVLGISNITFGNFIVGQLTEAVILGVLCFVGMVLLGFEYAVLISVLVGLSSIIPIVGAFIGLIPSVFILLIVNPSHAIGFLIFILILMQIEGNLIYPRVVGGSIGLPALWVLSALIVGGGLFGILGMLIGIPLASIIYQLLKADVNKRLA